MNSGLTEIMGELAGSRNGISPHHRHCHRHCHHRHHNCHHSHHHHPNPPWGQSSCTCAPPSISQGITLLSSVQKLLSSKRGNHFDIFFGNWGLLFWAQRSFLFASRRCTRVSSSLCQRPLQNFSPNLTFNFATFKQIASPFYLRILDAKTIWYNKIFQNFTNSLSYPHILHEQSWFVRNILACMLPVIWNCFGCSIVAYICLLRELPWVALIR